MVSANPPLTGQRPPTGPAILTPAANTWKRVSPALVPVLAVLTALLVTIPFMMITGGRGDLGRGFSIAMTAYAAFIEGALGIAINETLSADNIIQVRTLTENELLLEGDGQGLDRGELRQLSGRVNSLVRVGTSEVAGMADTLSRYTDRLDFATIDALGERIPGIVSIGDDNLRAMRPLLADLAALPSNEASRLVREYAALDALSEEDRARFEARVPAAAAYSDGELLNYARLIASRVTVLAVTRLADQLAVLDDLGLEPTDPDATNLALISTLKTSSRTGGEIALELHATAQRIDVAGIDDPTALAQQLNLVNAMYTRGVLSNPDVTTAISTELPPFLAENLVIYRPGQDPLLIVPTRSEPVGVLRNASGMAETVYLWVGDRALLFFPANLERTLTRSIPFIIAGLAVALGFKAGLFNIGAEGQLYMGGVLAVWVGFSPIFDFLPGALRMLVVLAVGIVGGGVWGMIPGVLKAFTGAHEVINTIMLNFIAIRLTDWLIRSKEPYILRDPAASVDQTPNVHPDAILPRLSQVGAGWWLLAGLLVLAWGLYSRRQALQGGQVGAALRPLVYAGLVVGAGFFLSWVTVRGALHLGLIVMVLTVLFIDWFLNRTTPGFELRTVGANANAARYAGMNVKWNIVLALTMAGGLAGLAGAIELSSVQYNMKPAFFSGLGFEAIAVALLARSNPRNMIPAGLLWAALATGAGPMQIRADISVDLVKIIQALIIMFIAADAIVRWLWRVPAASEAEKVTTTFSKGWGS